MSSKPSAAGHDAIRRAIVENRLAEAEAMIDALLFSNGNDAEAYRLAGQIAAMRRDPAGELALIQRAAALDPNNGEYRALLARCFAGAQQMSLSLASIEEALAHQPLSDLALDAMAGALAQFGRHREAAELLAQAAARGTRNAAIHFNLGNYRKFIGDFEGARASFEQSLVYAPSYHKAHAALTSLGGISAERNHLERLEQAIATTSDPSARIHLHHAASKEYEALGRYDEAWAQLTRGKRDLRQASPLPLDATIGAMDRLAAVARRALEQPARGYNDAKPIFVVGMPRTGTTVVDRILSNHSSVASIGESLYFPQLIKIASGSHGPSLLDDKIIDALMHSDLGSIGAQYVSHGDALSEGCARFADKFHLNFMLVGHILRALPEARILCLVRDPLDTIVSNFRQLFEYDSPLYAYSFDLMATTEFTIRFRRLAALWAEFAPDRFRAVSYEALVTGPEEEAKQMLAFCDLPWEEDVTAIDRNPTSTATASAVQVRRPITAGAVGNWRHYDAYLGEVKARLAAEGSGSGR